MTHSKLTEQINEEALRSLASGLSSIDVSDTFPPNGEPSRKAPACQEKTPRRISSAVYADTFLVGRPLERRVAVYVSEQVRDDVAAIVSMLGSRRLSAAGYIENVLRHHLLSYREQINECYKAVEHKQSLL